MTTLLLLAILAPAWTRLPDEGPNLLAQPWLTVGGATAVDGRAGRPGWRIEREKAGQDAVATTQVTGLQPGPYRLSAWFRPELRPTPDANFRAGLDITWLDADGRPLGSSRGPDAAGYQTAWTFAETAVAAPAGTAAAKVSFGFRTTSIGRCEMTDPVLLAGGAAADEGARVELARTASVVAPGDPVEVKLRGVPAGTAGWHASLLDSVGHPRDQLDLPAGDTLTLPTAKLPVGEWCQGLLEPRDAARRALAAPVSVGIMALPRPTDFSLREDSPFAILEGHPYLQRWIGARWQRPGLTWNDREFELSRRYGVIPMPMASAVSAALEGRMTLDAFATLMEDSVRHFKGTIKYWQIGNEPPLYQDGMPEKYVAVLRAGYQAVKRADPDAVVVMAGITGLDVDPVMIDKALAAGAGDYCDIIDLHLYVPIPQMDQLIKRVQADMKKHGVDKPLISTELTADLGSPLSDRQTAGHVYKRYAVGIANGMKQIYWFILRWPNVRVPYNHCALIDNLTEQPRMGAAAYRRLSDTLTAATYVDRETVDGGLWQFRFRNDSQAIYVVWTEGAKPLPASLRCGPGEVQLIDVAGRIRRLTTPGGLAITVTPEPVVVIAPWGAAEAATVTAPEPSVLARGARITVPVPTDLTLLDAPAGIACEKTANGWTLSASGDAPLTAEGEVSWSRAGELVRLPLRVVEPWRLALRPGWEQGAQIIAEVTRTAAELPAYRLDLSCPLDSARPARFALDSGTATTTPGVDRYVLPLPSAPDPAAQYGVTLAATMGDVSASTSRTMMFVPAARAEFPPTIDGKLADWPDAWPIRIGLNTGERRDPSDGPPTGPDDLSARAAARWDDQALYLAVTVQDDNHKNDSRDGAIWDGDGLQLGLTPEPDTVGATMVELGIALTSAGPQVWCWRNGTGKPTGPVKFAHAVVREGHETRYELAIPWSLLPVDQPGAGSWYGLGILLNEQDTGDRGCYGWQGGIGGDKNPREFGQIVLAP